MEAASKDALVTRLRDAASVYISAAESLAVHHHPLQSSPLFCSLGTVTLVMLIDTRDSVLVYSQK